ncbi:MAG: 2Fe-2S iron-sulfur cluster-binding protein, partial [Kaistella sp.]
EIDALAEKFEGRLKVIYLLSREKHFEDELFEGRISAKKLGQLFARFPEIPVQDSTYFICGPAEMIKDISGYLKNDRKVPSLQIMYEYYAAPDDGENAEMSDEFKAIPNLESMVTLIIDDDEYSFHLNSKKKSILDQALHDKLPVPFACKGGVCCTCKAQVMEGEVFMEKNFALTDEEVERGFVLTCQCHPTTNVVMLNYDV